MLEQVNWWTVGSAVNDVTSKVYRGVRKMSPALYTDYEGSVSSNRGDQVRMLDGQLVSLDNQIVALGQDIEACVRQIVETMRPSFGFMSSTSHFVAVVLSVGRNSLTDDVTVHVIWGVA